VVVASTVPLAWTVAARLARFAWLPWAVFTLAASALGVVASLGVDQVAHGCRS
jgi:hypothetical protein